MSEAAASVPAALEVNYTPSPLVPVRGVQSSDPWLYIRDYINVAQNDHTGNLAVITQHLMSHFNTEYNYMEVYEMVEMLVASVGEGSHRCLKVGSSIGLFRPGDMSGGRPHTRILMAEQPLHLCHFQGGTPSKWRHRLGLH